METALYTYEEAAPLLSDRYGAPLTGRAAVSRRLRILAERGAPLTVEAGELRQVGARRLITDLGLERLRTWKFGRIGRPRKNNADAAVNGCEQSK